jgi:hypothetical protein
MGDVNKVNFQSREKPIEKAPRRSSDRPPNAVPVRRAGQRSPFVELDDGSMVVFAPGARVAAERAQADVCFVFDTTGSMYDKIDGLITCMTGFVDDLAKLSLDWRTTCVPFGDLTVPGDRVESEWPFVSNADEAKEQLREMPRFYGGGNAGESSIEAMLAGLSKPWRPGAVRVIVLLTDDFALEPQRAEDIDARLYSEEAICFVASLPTPYYKSWAQNHGGRWFKIGPHMDTSSLLRVLKSMVSDIAKVAHDVHALAGGSVRRYIELTSGNSQIQKK